MRLLEAAVAAGERIRAALPLAKEDPGLATRAVISDFDLDLDEVDAVLRTTISAGVERLAAEFGVQEEEEIANQLGPAMLTIFLTGLLAGRAERSGDTDRAFTDPRTLGGEMAVDGENHALVDTSQAINVSMHEVCLIERPDGSQAFCYVVGGRIHRRPDVARVAMLGGLPFLVGLITQAYGVAERAGRGEELRVLCDEAWAKMPHPEPEVGSEVSSEPEGEQLAEFAMRAFSDWAGANGRAEVDERLRSFGFDPGELNKLEGRVPQLGAVVAGMMIGAAWARR